MRIKAISTRSNSKGRGQDLKTKSNDNKNKEEREQQSNDKTHIAWKRLSNTEKYLATSYVTHRWRLSHFFNHLALPLSQYVQYCFKLLYLSKLLVLWSDFLSSPDQWQEEWLVQYLWEKGKLPIKKNSCLISLWGKRDINQKT